MSSTQASRRLPAAKKNRWVLVFGFIGLCSIESARAAPPSATINPIKTGSIGKIVNPASAWLQAQTPEVRAEKLGEIAGCKGVSSFYQGDGSTTHWKDVENDAFWNVRCADGSSYSVMLSPDGSSKVLACSEMKLMHAGECFKAF